MLQVLGGADLFLQGWIVPDSGLGEFSAGDLRCVRIPQSPFPFAVGSLEVRTPWWRCQQLVRRQRLQPAKAQPGRPARRWVALMWRRRG